ncbi:MAG: 50S ribosomal protein L17 [Verrucomicrobia bacterium]|nr:50S ribosomal protein L17 [Verrucomicrobiota bacterium]
MRHLKKTVKLGRTADHRKALLANQVCSLIEHSRIKTTLAKAKAVRPFAERMVTLGKRGSLHCRRTAIAYLHNPGMVKKLFEEIAPRSLSRQGGYTRIIKLGPRPSDAAPMALLEWVDAAPVAKADTVEVPTAKQKKADAAAETDKPAADIKTSAPASAKTSDEQRQAKGQKKPAVRSRKTTDKAKRAEDKAKKERAAAQPKPKSKLGPKGKGKSGGKKR